MRLWPAIIATSLVAGCTLPTNVPQLQGGAIGVLPICLVFCRVVIDSGQVDGRAYGTAPTSLSLETNAGTSPAASAPDVTFDEGSGATPPQ